MSVFQSIIPSQLLCIAKALSAFLVVHSSLQATQIVSYSLDGYFDFVDNPDASQPVWAPILRPQEQPYDGYPFRGRFQFRFPQSDLLPDDPSVGLYRDRGPQVSLHLDIGHPETGASVSYDLSGPMESELVLGGPFVILVNDGGSAVQSEIYFPFSVPPDPEDVGQLPDSTSADFLLNLNRATPLFALRDGPLLARTNQRLIRFHRPTITVPDSGSSFALLGMAGSALALAAGARRKRGA